MLELTCAQNVLIYAGIHMYSLLWLQLFNFVYIMHTVVTVCEKPTAVRQVGSPQPYL